MCCTSGLLIGGRFLAGLRGECYRGVTRGGASCARHLTLVRWAGSVGVAGGLDQLDEHATGVLGVDEVDPAVRRAASGGVVQESHAALAQDRGDLLDVADPEGQLLE